MIGLPGDHMSDSASCHHWILPAQCNTESDWPQSCVCGMISKQEHTKLSLLTMERPNTKMTPSHVPSSAEACRLLDSYPVMLNALKIGIGTAVMVLGICNIIVDVN